jgi:hypothetical protein
VSLIAPPISHFVFSCSHSEANFTTTAVRSTTCQPKSTYFQILRADRTWHIRCSANGMNMKLLLELSYQITTGNPLWGLALLNEYPDAPPALRAGLIRALQVRAGRTLESTPLLQALLSGRRACELAPAEREALGSRVMRHGLASPSPRLRKRTSRIARRQRLSTGSLHRCATQVTYAHRHHDSRKLALVR